MNKRTNANTNEITRINFKWNRTQRVNRFFTITLELSKCTLENTSYWGNTRWYCHLTLCRPTSIYRKWRTVADSGRRSDVHGTFILLLKNSVTVKARCVSALSNVIVQGVTDERQERERRRTTFFLSISTIRADGFCEKKVNCKVEVSKPFRIRNATRAIRLLFFLFILATQFWQKLFWCTCFLSFRENLVVKSSYLVLHDKLLIKLWSASIV